MIVGAIEFFRQAQLVIVLGNFSKDVDAGKIGDQVIVIPGFDGRADTASG